MDNKSLVTVIRESTAECMKSIHHCAILKLTCDYFPLCLMIETFGYLRDFSVH